ncbi:hypothetical protein ANN_27753 [Periplaneta americana]|uniref:Regulatory protein zeste n=1 Tax=Periplaneta americana TaxID=6978 RepID=A0ABQ8RV50_PERAM|nr:hypothetical protein ANN_27753 [Periplaneta americana]
MEEKVKRTRSSNFTNKEKAIFVDVLPDYLNVIENKKTDGISVRHKECAWEKLANEYNSHPEVTKRTVKQLKVFYDSFKRQSKKNYVNEKVALYQTGGGLPTVPKIMTLAINFCR